jgi:hydrogenase/urease accessory protein HupE
MNVMQGRLVAIAVALTAPCAVLAHSGQHDEAGEGGLLHALTQLDHLAGIVLIGAIVVAATNAASAVIVRVRRYRDAR